ncbi:lipase 3-like [Drosophila kikkawai]|uniref:Lipase 3-like n=1 Tax=Drosophila kikkawai TaxID=30033 RepID=A0ABM3C8L1_DROKI|nr:lipase 3-like [Drosophila kikkawai]
MAKILFKTLGIYEAPPKSEAQRKVFHRLCSFIFQNTCTFVLMEIMGVDYQQFNTSLVPLFRGHTQAGSSIKSMEHYGQQIHSGGFFKFDYYNKLENLRRHGAVKPPQYNVSRVDCKVALYYAKNDRLTSDIDVVRLRNQLPNVILDYLIPDCNA